MSNRNLRMLIIAAVATLSGLAAWLYAPLLIDPQQKWAVTLAVFVSVKIGGDVCALVMVRQPLFIVEDFIRDMLGFGVLALFAFFVTVLAERFIGGEVGPLIPAVGAYVVYSIMSSDH